MSIASKCPDFLSAPDACVRGQCVAATCDHRVKRNDLTGRWFITMGHAGFNSPANNGIGYTTAMRALAAHRRCASAGQRVRAMGAR
jgi:hypothetical protein